MTDLMPVLTQHHTTDAGTDAGIDAGIDVRLKISALWIAMLVVFAYVDLFSLYRADVRADLDAGKIFVFDVNQTFLFFTTLYILIPSAMVYLSLVMPRRTNRIVNIGVAAVYTLTIVGGAVGEWSYYLLGSAMEAVLLASVVRHSWRWAAPADPAQPIEPAAAPRPG